MLRRAGQARRRLGRLLHHPLRLAGTMLLVLLIGLGIASWRLSQGPVELPFLAARIGAAASRLHPGLDINIGHARLAWEGFHTGGAPLDLRLSAISLRMPKGSIAGVISRLQVTLAPLALLRGRIAPIQIIAQGTAITMRPQPGHNTIGTTTAARLAHALRQAPPGRRTLDLDQLRLIRVLHADIILDDPRTGLHLAAPDSAMTLRRTADGAIAARATALFHGGPQAAGSAMPVAITYDAASGHGVLRAVAGPGSLPELLPQVKALAALHLPVTLSADLPFGQNQRPGMATLHVALGRGSVGIAQGTVPVHGAAFTLALDKAGARLTEGRIRLGGSTQNPPPLITLAGSATGTSTIQGTVTVTANQVEAALLPLYWPKGLARLTRRFVLARIAGGTASGGLFHFGITWTQAARQIRLDRFDGTFNARGVVFTWFKGMPPMTGLTGTLHFPDKDHLRIHAESGAVGGFAIGKTLVTIDGVSHKDQNVVIAGSIAGPVRAAAAMLMAPRLQHGGQGLLPVQAAQVQGAQGMARVQITLYLPLKKHLTIQDVHLAAVARLTKLALPLPLGRLALHDGDVRVKASIHQVSMAGSGMIGDQPARVSGSLMRMGARRFTFRLATMLDRTLLTSAGFNSSGWERGAAPLSVAVIGTPGQADAALRADLTSFAFALPALGWSKPQGAAGQVSLDVGLRGGKTVIRRIAASAPGLLIAAQGDGSSVAVSTLDIGRSRASGRITLPPHPGAPWLIALAGPVLDLSGAVAQAAQAGGQTATQAHDRAKAVPWQMRGAFGRLILRESDTHDQSFGGMTALRLQAEGTGAHVGAIRATALLAPSQQVELSIAPVRTGLRLRLVTSDGGALLAAFGVADTVTGGALDLTADQAGGTLQGRAIMTRFRLRHAPMIGKVLQGMTLYGLAEATSGPGLAFSRLVAPFTLAHQVLTIRNGRAYSASLGVTMTGEAYLARKTYNLGGTIVPAYALNSLPGRIPVLGRLFRTRKGSGLFSARFTVDGPFARPHIAINPLAALTPGVLANIFGSGPPNRSAANLSKHP